MEKSGRWAAVAMSGWMLGAIGFSSLAAEPPFGVPLPEADYQAARKEAAARYTTAIAACGFQSWYARDACERAALEDLERADLEARNAYLRTQADIAKLRDPQGAAAPKAGAATLPSPGYVPPGTP